MALITIPYDGTISFRHISADNDTVDFFKVVTNGNSIGVANGIPHQDPATHSCDFISDEDIISPCRFHNFNISAKGDVAYFIIVVAVYAAFGVLGIV